MSIAELLHYNVTFRRPDRQVNLNYHSTSREPPLPVYFGLLVHAKTRKKGLVETLSKLGLSITYDRVLEISATVGNQVLEQFSAENVVCPPNLEEGLFTSAAVDNIDHNPSSATARDSFHGTGISLFQQPSFLNEGRTRNIYMEIESIPKKKKLMSLPYEYSTVHPVVMPVKDPPIPESTFELQNNGILLSDELEKEQRFGLFLFRISNKRECTDLVLKTVCTCS